MNPHAEITFTCLIIGHVANKYYVCMVKECFEIDICM